MRDSFKNRRGKPRRGFPLPTLARLAASPFPRRGGAWGINLATGADVSCPHFKEGGNRSCLNKQAGRQALRVMGKARVYNQWLVDLVRPFLGERVLEVGAGMGNMSELLVGEAAVLTVCDVEGEYLGVLRRKLGEGVAVKRVDLAGSREQLPREGFDTVLCFNVLEHVRGEKRAIENMRYWLKEGGRLLLLVPAHAWLYSELDRKLGHVRRYARREVEEILRGTGWREVKVGYVNWIGALGWWLVVKMMKWGRVPRGGMGMFGAGGFLFRWAVAIESFLKLPFGLSVLAVAKK